MVGGAEPGLEEPGDGRCDMQAVAEVLRKHLGQLALMAAHQAEVRPVGALGRQQRVEQQSLRGPLPLGHVLAVHGAHKATSRGVPAPARS